MYWARGYGSFWIGLLGVLILAVMDHVGQSRGPRTISSTNGGRGGILGQVFRLVPRMDNALAEYEDENSA